MLLLLLGTDWVANRDIIHKMIADEVTKENKGNVLIVPELVSHDTERRLCAVAGDTCSYYAEVLSFTQLARRVADSVGHGAKECLDNGGRIVAMASAARQLHSKLKAYASVETKPEFLMGLLDAVDEFKRSCISADALKTASEMSEGAFAQKLEELSLLYEAYNSICARGKRDPRDQMTWLLEELADSDYASNHVFYVDGFPDFSQQHLEILSLLIASSAKVVVSLNCDCVNSKKLAFERVGETAAQLIRCASRAGVEIKQQVIAPYPNPLSEIRTTLFQGTPADSSKLSSGLRTYRCRSVYDECVWAAQNIMDLIRSGNRYRDISVVCADMATYKNTLRTVFSRCGIPAYISGTEQILDKPVISTVLSGIDAALSGFEQNSVLKFLKSPLSLLTGEECDRLEKYVILWSISGSRFAKSWTSHPEGLKKEWTEADTNELTELNRIREKFISPLLRLKEAFDSATTLKDRVIALYRFTEDIHLANNIDLMSARMTEKGDGRTSQILDQLWDIWVGALEQLYDVLGETAWDSDSFTRLLRLLLSQYDVGTIPPVLDAVYTGPANAMRCQQCKHLFVLGAVEGAFPAYGTTKGVFSEQERKELTKLGVPLTRGMSEELQIGFYEIYGVFCGAEESITASYSDGRPSFVFTRLCNISPEQTVAEDLLGAALNDRSEAAAYLVRKDAEAAALRLGLTDEYRRMLYRKSHSLGAISAENVNKLYGDKLSLSASRIDTLANCRLSYFLNYGLNANPIKPVSVDPTEFGTFVHTVLEETAKKVMEEGGFHNVTMERTLEISNEYSAVYISQHFGELESERLTYLLSRNGQELDMIVRELWAELNITDFEPFKFELSFGLNKEMPPVMMSGKNISAILGGFVDRVDIWNHNNQSYFRVVDYKTGGKSFDYCDVFNGLGLQMLLYLFALEDNGSKLFEHTPVPVGVHYFPAKAPYLTADGLLDASEADKKRQPSWKRNGLTLFDGTILEALQPEGAPKRINFNVKKDGTITGDLADRAQFKLLKKYVFHIVGSLIDEIASGCVDPNPYTRGNEHNACRFCDYRGVCNAYTVTGRRNYKEMNAEEFWMHVCKEVGEDDSID